jgi:hypothetical protein
LPVVRDDPRGTASLLDVRLGRVLAIDVAEHQLPEQALELDSDAGDRAVLVDGKRDPLVVARRIPQRRAVER